MTEQMYAVTINEGTIHETVIALRVDLAPGVDASNPIFQRLLHDAAMMHWVEQANP